MSIVANPRPGVNAALLQDCGKVRRYRDRNGEIRERRCCSPRCCLVGRKRWASRTAAALCRSFRLLSPTHEARVSLFRWPAKEFLAALQGFQRRLKYELQDRQAAGLEWCRVVHWPDGADVHAHYVLRTDGELSEELLLRLWQRCHPKEARDDADAHLSPVRSGPALAHYVTCNVVAGLAPAGWRGRAVSYSGSFLAAPVRTLWQECLDERYEPGPDN
jgi:hypothetical protein